MSDVNVTHPNQHVNIILKSQILSHAMIMETKQLVGHLPFWKQGQAGVRVDPINLNPKAADILPLSPCRMPLVADKIECF